MAQRTLLFLIPSLLLIAVVTSHRQTLTTLRPQFTFPSQDPVTDITRELDNATTLPYSSTYYSTLNYTSGPTPTIQPEFVVMIPMIIMTITAMYGNAVVIYTLTSLQTRSQHLTIMLSLACSDFITSSVLMPCIALSAVTHEPISPKWCLIFPYLAYTVFYTSFGHLGFISVEQCYRLWNYSSYQKRMTPTFVKSVCTFIWLFAATAFVYPIQRIMRPVYARHHFICIFAPKQGIGDIKTQTFILYGITMLYRAVILIILVSCYCLIFIKMYMINKKKSSLTRGSDGYIKEVSALPPDDDHEFKEYKPGPVRGLVNQFFRPFARSEPLLKNKTNKSAVIMLAVIVVFFFSWFPDFLVQLLNITKVLGGAPMWLSRFIVYNYYISPMFNPMIYTIGYKHVRKQMFSTITMGEKKNKFFEPDEFPPLTYVDRSKKIYRRESDIEQIEVIDQIEEADEISIEIEDPSLEEEDYKQCNHSGSPTFLTEYNELNEVSEFDRFMDQPEHGRFTP